MKFFISNTRVHVNSTMLLVYGSNACSNMCAEESDLINGQAS